MFSIILPNFVSYKNHVPLKYNSVNKIKRSSSPFHKISRSVKLVVSYDLSFCEKNSRSVSMTVKKQKKRKHRLNTKSWRQNMKREPSQNPNWQALVSVRIFSGKRRRLEACYSKPVRAIKSWELLFHFSIIKCNKIFSINLINN